MNIVSDCCNAEIDEDILICMQCREHADAVDLDNIDDDYYETTEERGEEK